MLNQADCAGVALWNRETTLGRALEKALADTDQDNRNQIFQYHRAMHEVIAVQMTDLHSRRSHAEAWQEWWWGLLQGLVVLSRAGGRSSTIAVLYTLRNLPENLCCLWASLLSQDVHTRFEQR